MAGEVEDRTGLQAECLRTGSISFGRFETENLSWEKRSSFLHNRYLEEVEKFSAAGSVTQKKAYFEAQFKKRGLVRQGSSTSPIGSEGHSSEFTSEDRINHSHVYEEQCNEDIGCVDDIQNHYDELEGSHGHEEVGDKYLVADEVVTNESCDGDKYMTLSSELQGEQAFIYDETPILANAQNATSTEQQHSSLEYDIASLLVDSQASVESEITRILNDDNSGKEDSQRVDPQIGTGDFSSTTSLKSHDKVKPSPGEKYVKSKQKPQMAERRLQNPKNERKMVKQRPGCNGPQQAKQMKKISLTESSASPSISMFMKSHVIEPSTSLSISTVMKSQDSKDLKPRRTLLIKSEQKDSLTPRINSGVKAAAVAPSSRRPRAISSLKSGPTIINSKSTERDASNKEGAKMSGRTMNANFKATPLPAFYREVGSRSLLLSKTPTRFPNPSNASTGIRPATNFNKSASLTTSNDSKIRAKLNSSNIIHSATKAGNKSGIQTASSDPSSRVNKKIERSKGKLIPQDGVDRTVHL